MQERRKLYAEFLTQLDEIIYLTTHALASANPQHPPTCQHDGRAATQEWMQGHQHLSSLVQEILLVGSLEFYELALEAHGSLRR